MTRIIARLGAVTATTALAMAAVVGPAAPVQAAFDSQPLRGWEPDGPVHAIAVAGDTVYIGGSFTSLTDPATGQTVPRGGLAALDSATGELMPGWSASADGEVLALAVSEDGSQVVAGGKFRSVNGETRRRLVGLSAATGDLISPWRGRAAGAVQDLLVQGNRLYVGGAFSRLNGVRERGLGALQVSDGSHVDSFNAFVDDTVYALADGGAGRLLVAGRFSAVNGAPRGSLAAVSSTTGALTPWAPARLCSGCGTYWDVASDQTRVYVASSGPGGRVAAIDVATKVRRWVTRADGDVQAVDVGTDGLLYIGGHFNQQVGGLPRHQLAAVKATTGAVDPDFAPRLFRPYPGVEVVKATANRLYAGGHFSGVGRRGKSPYFTLFSTG